MDIDSIKIHYGEHMKPFFSVLDLQAEELFTNILASDSYFPSLPSHTVAFVAYVDNIFEYFDTHNIPAREDFGWYATHFPCVLDGIDALHPYCSVIEHNPSESWNPDAEMEILMIRTSHNECVGLAIVPKD